MSKTLWERLMLFHYGNCKNELHELTQLKVDNEKRIKQLEKEVIDLMGQVKEGKLFLEYHTAALEKEVSDMKEKLNEKTCSGQICTTAPSTTFEHVQIEALKEENRSLKKEIEDLKKRYAYEKKNGSPLKEAKSKGVNL